MSGVGITDNANGQPTGAQAADKSALRHQALARRKLTSAEERLDAGHALVQQLTGSSESESSQAMGPLKSGATVAAYVSMGSEIETRPLLGWLLERGCTVLVPKLGSGLEIGWSVLRSLDDLHAVDGHGHLRPDEPEGETLPPQALIQASAVFAPALGVDQRGFRLGRGAGWYDRALAARASGCPLIAICWPWEVMDGNLPAEPHDVPADAVLTPNGFHMLSRNAGHDIPAANCQGND
ncbi:5-formyltetrahydrofolate cyclo-ligase [Bifidobacterium felsineum]|uniref:5-formyltetrahydrofolate cyclo-ligase n=1 Tax=Bifidobacterium felsineum TaxID=2045440 RepID=UPI001BDDA965|nr:5-formyltetrahydrofolate cyclo-ligase [Bifidobacterium felsineum]MBT1163497.1 5-formyltetrahydrofolate cyclo-ligase [Bifidobacterium felsineum]